MDCLSNFVKLIESGFTKFIFIRFYFILTTCSFEHFFSTVLNVKDISTLQKCGIIVIYHKLYSFFNVTIAISWTTKSSVRTKIQFQYRIFWFYIGSQSILWLCIAVKTSISLFTNIVNDIHTFSLFLQKCNSVLTDWLCCFLFSVIILSPFWGLIHVDRL